MRATCARALAVALMTGAIAGVVGMAALVRTPTEAGAPMSAPPSSLQRSVRLVAEPAPRPRRHPLRVVARPTIHVRARPSVARPSLAVVRRHAPAPRRPERRRQLAAVTPAAPAEPTPEPPTAPPAATDPAPSSAEADGEAEAEAEDEDDGPGHGQGRGHAYGHERQDD